MTRNVWLLAAGLLVLAAVATNPAGCGATGELCESGGVECVYAADCETLIWSNERCTEGEGRWQCVGRACESTCPGECETAGDCQNDRSWPDGVGCAAHEGDWICEDTFCVAVCPGECEAPADCEDKFWPSHARCLESEGDWGCENSICVPVCPPECETAGDCQDRTWPTYLDCSEVDGYWACEETFCVAVCPVDCRVPVDCEGTPWPAELACPEDEGHWTCQDEACVAACDVPCVERIDCAAYEWTLDCVGYFHCAEGSCVQYCSDINCGDGRCDAEGGETPESCPPDCDPTCDTFADCLGQEWDAQCEGRWDCPADTCVEICDYDSCGDGMCTPAEGEDEQTCPRDCQQGCDAPVDCRYEPWNALCFGHWECEFETRKCKEECSFFHCSNGNDSCDLLVGETEVTCPPDCLGGPCSDVIDCLGSIWNEGCGGHWRCNPPPPVSQIATGACDPICDASGCGDGVCDVLAGETPVSCEADCSGYTCTQSDDCDTLALPGGCDGWICSGRVCAPQCE